MNSEAPVLVLGNKFELPESVLARPPRVMARLALAAAVLLAVVIVWAAVSEMDLVVTCPLRIKTSSCPLKGFSETAGQRVMAGVAGRIIEVRCQAGDRVHEGEPLVRLDSERNLDNQIAKLLLEINLDREELQQLEQMVLTIEQEKIEAIEQALAELEEAKENLSTARERLELDKNRNKADQTYAEVSVAQYKDQLSRLEPLVSKGAAPQNDLISTRFGLEQAEMRLKYAQVKPSEADVRQAERRLETSKRRIPPIERQHAMTLMEHQQRMSDKKGELEGKLKLLANLRIDKEKSQIRAPFSGLVTQCESRAGDFVDAGQGVLTVARMDGFEVHAAVSATDVGLVHAGMPVRIKLNAFDYQQYGTLKGHVVYVNPDTEAADSTVVYLVRIAVDENGEERGIALRLGMTGQAEIITARECVLSLLTRWAKRGLDPHAPSEIEPKAGKPTAFKPSGGARIASIKKKRPAQPDEAGDTLAAAKNSHNESPSGAASPTPLENAGSVRMVPAYELAGSYSFDLAHEPLAGLGLNDSSLHYLDRSAAPTGMTAGSKNMTGR